MNSRNSSDLGVFQHQSYHVPSYHFPSAFMDSNFTQSRRLFAHTGGLTGSPPQEAPLPMLTKSDGQTEDGHAMMIRNMNGEFERISHGGKVLKDTTAMTAEREASRAGVEHLMTLFPVEAKDFQFVVEKIRSPCVSSAFATMCNHLHTFGLVIEHAWET